MNNPTTVQKPKVDSVRVLSTYLTKYLPSNAQWVSNNSSHEPALEPWSGSPLRIGAPLFFSFSFLFPLSFPYPSLIGYR
jgi:hypothetical protein